MLRESEVFPFTIEVMIRKLTNGQKSLDDFCTLFHGQNDNGKVWVKPYDADEVYRTMNTVAAYDWKSFFEQRLRSKAAELPLGGVENGGFRLAYTDAPNMFTDPWVLDGSLNAYGSLGIHVGADGTVDDSWPGSPAYAAGISNGMRIVAVNGRRFSSDELKRAIAASTPTTDARIDFIIENASYFSVTHVTYRGGLRYPHLAPKPGATDVLKAIAASRSKS